MIRINNWKLYFEKQYGSDYKFMTYEFNFNFLYRGRTFKERKISEVQNKLEHTKRIWSPPRKECSKQRCSDKFENKLYLSSHISSIPLELECNESDLIALVKYKQLYSFQPLSVVGLNDLIRLPIEGDFTEKLSHHHDRKSDKIIRIDSILSNIFKSRKRQDGLDIYDLTIALTHLYLRKTIGLIYPSVAAGYKSFNIVLKQQLVKTMLKPVEIGIYRVVDINSNEYAEFRRLSIGEIFENGQIKWRKETNDIVLRYEK